MAVPTFEQWLRLSDKERAQEVAQLNGYDGVGESLMDQITERFREEFGHLPSIQIGRPGIPQGGGWAITATHDFVFDRRWLPSVYLGVPVKTGVRDPLPPEFANQHYPTGYAWSPPNFERFVDRCAPDIEKRLGVAHMSRDDMLHALIGVPFQEFVAQCREWVRQGMIPPFE